MVNRFWQQYFGTGLVKTQEDFGNQGDLPPPRIAGLAGRAVSIAGWSVTRWSRNAGPVTRVEYKNVYSSISTLGHVSPVLTDDQSAIRSGPRQQMAGPWIELPLYGRAGPGQRLIRQWLIGAQIGGPSVYPYQPAGIWEALATRNTISYRQQHGDSLYRRSMYTIWKRTSPPPMMLNFDAPDRAPVYGPSAEDRHSFAGAGHAQRPSVYRSGARSGGANPETSLVRPSTDYRLFSGGSVAATPTNGTGTPGNNSIGIRNTLGS